MDHPRLFMLLLGCKPAGRNTEQHDIFFGIANTLKGLLPQIESFWPGAGKIHIDGWREVNYVDGYTINIIPKSADRFENSINKLFFLNLGGYKENEFEEYHYKLLSISENKSKAILNAKQSAFYKHTGFKGADSHIDDKYGIDVDDIYEIEDILSPSLKAEFSIQISNMADQGSIEDKLHLGYLKLSSLI